MNPISSLSLTLFGFYFVFEVLIVHLERCFLSLPTRFIKIATN